MQHCIIWTVWHAVPSAVTFLTPHWCCGAVAIPVRLQRICPVHCPCPHRCFSQPDPPPNTFNHAVCSACIRQNLEFQERSNGQPGCPTCRRPCDARDLGANVALRELSGAYRAARLVLLALPLQTHEARNTSRAAKAPVAVGAAVHQQRQQQETGAQGGGATRPSSMRPRRSANKQQGLEQAAATPAPAPAPNGSRAGVQTRSASRLPNRSDGSAPAAAVAPPAIGSKRPRTSLVAAAAVEPAAAPPGKSDSDFCIEIEDCSEPESGSSGQVTEPGEGESSSDVESASPSPPSKRAHAHLRSGGKAVAHAGKQSEPAEAQRREGQQVSAAAQHDTPAGFVHCPVCDRTVPAFFINSHVDQCLVASSGGGSAGGGHYGRQHHACGAPPQDDDDDAFISVKVANVAQQQQQQPFEPLLVPAKIVPSLISDKGLRALLKKYGLPTDGKKKASDRLGRRPACAHEAVQNAGGAGQTSIAHSYSAWSLL